MKIGDKWYFTSKQACEIKQLLEIRKKSQNKEEIRKIAQRLRNRGFYLSEFGQYFTKQNFEQEIQLGNIIIDDNAIPQNIQIPTQDENGENNKVGCIAFIVITIIISILISLKDGNSKHSPKVLKTEHYNSSYDQQVNDLKRDIQKCDDWVKSIVIYDDNCDSVATISR